MKLANAPVNSIFVDKNSLYDNQPVEWIVAAQNVDGDGITTLMKNTVLSNMVFDAKEPQNPNGSYQSQGNGNYEYSNIIQWLNSEKGAGEWYFNQHEYDQAPDSDAVGDTYANKAGFLNGFSDTFISAMQTVEKMSVSRKVHLPSYQELGGSKISPYSSTSYSSNVLDVGASYPNYKHPYDLTKPSPYMFPWATVRASSTGTRVIGTRYVSYSESYSGTTPGWYYYDYSAVSKSANYYIIPVIYVRNTIPVIYDSETSRYVLDYSIETEFSDYGNHKGGFDFNIKITSSETGSTSVLAYADGNEIKTFTVSTYNQYVTLTFSDSDLSSLSESTHAIRLVATKDGATTETSFTYEKVAESVPTIASNNVGNVAQAFDTTYQVYDDDGDSIDVVIKLDDSQIDSKTNVEQKTDLTISVGASRFNSLSYGNHTLSIVATDGTNEVTKDIAFKKCSVPSVSIVNPTIGEVVSPFSVQVNYSNADGGGSHVQGVY